MFTFRHLGFEKLKHTIEPEVQYLFVPQVSRPVFDIPRCGTVSNPRPGVNCSQGATLFSEGFLFDERDAIDRRNFVSYGFTTRLLGRGATSADAGEPEKAPAAGAPVDPDALAQGLSADALPGTGAQPAAVAGAGPPTGPSRELLRASIVQGFDVSRQLVGPSHLSDVDVGFRASPVDYLSLSYNTTVNLEHPAIRGVAVGTVLREPWWTPPTQRLNYQSPSSIGISYRFVEQNVNQGIHHNPTENVLFETSGVNEVDGSVYLRLGDYLGFTFLSRYDLNSTTTVSDNKTTTLGPHFLERDYLLRLISRCNCWVLEAGVADKTNPDERLFRFQLTLLGLGAFGSNPATHNYVGPPGLPQTGLRRPAAVGGGAY